MTINPTDRFMPPTDQQIARINDLPPQQFGQLYAMAGFNDFEGLRRLHRLGRFVENGYQAGSWRGVDSEERAQRLSRFEDFSTFVSEGVEAGDLVVMPVGGAVVDKATVEAARITYMGCNILGTPDIARQQLIAENPDNRGINALRRMDASGDLGAAVLLGTNIAADGGSDRFAVHIADGAYIQGKRPNGSETYITGIFGDGTSGRVRIGYNARLIGSSVANATIGDGATVIMSTIDGRTVERGRVIEKDKYTNVIYQGMEAAVQLVQTAVEELCDRIDGGRQLGRLNKFLLEHGF